MENIDRITSISNVVTSFEKLMLIDSIFQQVQEFLDGNTDSKNTDSNNTDSNNVLNLSRNFTLIKKTNYSWRLNKECSLEYYHHVTYRSELGLGLGSGLGLDVFSKAPSTSY
jgi:hypothetical protein